ncbi:MAG: biotin transporter BioY, partial [Elusimicrobia bacterium]
MLLKTKGMILCALFAALTAVGGLIAVPLPFTPVPITLQTFFTFLAGAILGKYLGALSQIIYLLLGVIGLPVFAKGSSGIGVLLGP